MNNGIQRTAGAGTWILPNREWEPKIWPCGIITKAFRRKGTVLRQQRMPRNQTLATNDVCRSNDEVLNDRDQHSGSRDAINDEVHNDRDGQLDSRDQFYKRLFQTWDWVRTRQDDVSYEISGR